MGEPFHGTTIVSVRRGGGVRARGAAGRSRSAATAR